MAATDITYMSDVTTAQQVVTSSPNITEEERRRYLSHLDDVTFPYMVPTVVYLSILMFFGIIGNILVLIVYKKKFKPSPTRVFIVSLAVFDLMICTISLPGEILDVRYTHTFEYPKVCGILRFNNMFLVLSSAFILNGVVIDRYRKICRPLRRQITIRDSRVMVGIAMSVSLVLSIPTIILNGQKTVLTDREGITGVECSYDDRWRDTMFPLDYNGVLCVIFFGNVSFLITIYIRIGKIIFTHWKFKFRLANDTKSPALQKSTCEKELSSDDEKTSAKENKITCISPKKRTIMTTTLVTSTDMVGVEKPSKMSTSQIVNKRETTKKRETVIFTRRSDPVCNEVTLTSVANLEGNWKNSSAQSEGKSDPRASKTTLLLFIITAVFIITLLPYLILIIIRELKSDIFDSLHGGGTMMYNVFIRSYFINSAVNCIVYSFCNIRFRKGCKRLVC